MYSDRWFNLSCPLQSISTTHTSLTINQQMHKHALCISRPTLHEGTTEEVKELLAYSISTHYGYLHTSHKQSQHFDVQSKSNGSRQNKRSTRDFAREFLWSSKHYGPGQKLKRLGKSCSLHLKKILVGGLRIFVSDVISGGLLGHLGPLCLALGLNC